MCDGTWVQGEFIKGSDGKERGGLVLLFKKDDILEIGHFLDGDENAGKGPVLEIYKDGERMEAVYDSEGDPVGGDEAVKWTNADGTPKI